MVTMQFSFHAPEKIVVIFYGRDNVIRRVNDPTMKQSLSLSLTPCCDCRGKFAWILLVFIYVDQDGIDCSRKKSASCFIAAWFAVKKNSAQEVCSVYIFELVRVVCDCN